MRKIERKSGSLTLPLSSDIGMEPQLRVQNYDQLNNRLFLPK